MQVQNEQMCIATTVCVLWVQTQTIYFNKFVTYENRSLYFHDWNFHYIIRYRL